mmetsp:Transcript_32259/g.90795  ORF Transcript_32259/g.90795 Transcript_32259/m.90795 type:complete len:218 (+) Transcript_32259:839-1492(+)
MVLLRASCVLFSSAISRAASGVPLSALSGSLAAAASACGCESGVSKRTSGCPSASLPAACGESLAPVPERLSSMNFNRGPSFRVDFSEALSSPTADAWLDMLLAVCFSWSGCLPALAALTACFRWGIWLPSRCDMRCSRRCGVALCAPCTAFFTLSSKKTGRAAPCRCAVSPSWSWNSPWNPLGYTSATTIFALPMRSSFRMPLLIQTDASRYSWSE